MKFYETLPQEAHEVTSNFLIDNNQTIKSIGVIVSNLILSEGAIELVTALNHIVDTDPFVSCCIFNMEKDLPSVAPHFAIYDANDINTFYFQLAIGFDVPAWSLLKSCPTDNKYLYVYDSIIAASCPPEIIKQINNTNIKIIARNSEQIKFLKHLGYANISERTMEYVDPWFLKGLISYD